MSKISYTALFFLSLQFNVLNAQHAFYFGGRLDATVYQTRLSEPVDIGIPFGVSAGLVLNYYNFQKPWELTLDVTGSLSGVDGKTKPYNNCFFCSGNNGNVPVETSAKSILYSLDFNYTFLYSIDTARRFKMGLGIWNNWGSNFQLFSAHVNYVNSDYIEKYAAYSVYTKNNYGISLEGIYKIDRFDQISIRFRFGFANLYTDPNNSLVWKQNGFSIGVIHYWHERKNKKLIIQKPNFYK